MREPIFKTIPQPIIDHLIARAPEHADMAREFFGTSSTNTEWMADGLIEALLSPDVEPYAGEVDDEIGEIAVIVRGTDYTGSFMGDFNALLFVPWWGANAGAARALADLVVDEWPALREIALKVHAEYADGFTVSALSKRTHGGLTIEAHIARTGGDGSIILSRAPDGTITVLPHEEDANLFSSCRLAAGYLHHGNPLPFDMLAAAKRTDQVSV